MDCPVCGEKIERSANFCPECGTEIPDTVQKTNETQQPPPQEGRGSHELTTAGSDETQADGRSLVTRRRVLGGILGTGAVVGGWYWHQSRQSPPFRRVTKLKPNGRAGTTSFTLSENAVVEVKTTGYERSRSIPAVGYIIDPDATEVVAATGLSNLRRHAQLAAGTYLLAASGHRSALEVRASPRSSSEQSPTKSVRRVVSELNYVINGDTISNLYDGAGGHQNVGDWDMIHGIGLISEVSQLDGYAVEHLQWELALKQAAGELGGSIVDRVNHMHRVNTAGRASLFTWYHLPRTNEVAGSLLPVLSGFDDLPDSMPDDLNRFRGLSSELGNYVSYVIEPANLSSLRRGEVGVGVSIVANTFELNEVPWTDERIVYNSPTVPIPVRRTQLLPSRWEIDVDDPLGFLTDELGSMTSENTSGD